MCRLKGVGTLHACLACLLVLAGCAPSAFWSGDSSTLATDLGGKLSVFDVSTAKSTTLDTGDSIVVLKQGSADRRFEARIVPSSGGSSELLTVFESPMGTVAPDLKSVVYMGGEAQRSVIYERVPFAERRVLHRIGNVPAAEPTRLEMPAVAYPVLSGDGKTIALSLMNGRRELRLYDVETGRKTIYPMP